MDELSPSAVSSQRLWSQALQQKKKTRGLLCKQESTATFPVLTRRSDGQQYAATSSRKKPVHAFLLSKLDGNDGEFYSRRQLRAIANSKLLPNINNDLASTKFRIHGNNEYSKPRGRTSFEKSRAQQHQSLPLFLRAKIDEILVVRSTGELLSDRDESNSANDSNNWDLPRIGHSSPSKLRALNQGSRWRKYIRCIMMTKGIQGSTLARYRRLVGNIARKCLTQSYTSAIERVVRYRLVFRSAVVIQRLVLQFLRRHRQVAKMRRYQAAATVEGAWRRFSRIKKQRKMAEIARQVQIERLARMRAAHLIQRAYQKYQCACREHEEALVRQQHANRLQKARLKLLQRYQSWRQKLVRNKLDWQVGEVSSIAPSEIYAEEEVAKRHEPNRSILPVESSRVEVTATCVFPSSVLDSAENLCASTEAPQEILISIEKPFASSFSDEMQLTEKMEDQEPPLLEDAVVSPQANQSPETLDGVPSTLPSDKSRPTTQNEVIGDALALTDQDNLLTSALTLQECEMGCAEVTLTLTEPISDSCDVKAEPEDDNESCGNNLDMCPPADVSYLDNLRQFSDNCVDLTDEMAATESVPTTSGAEREAKTAAGARIVRYVQLRRQALQTKKTCAAVRIQCLARSILAKQNMVRVRLEALQSLREQLYASWHHFDGRTQTLCEDKESEENVLESPERDDEEDGFDVEGQEISNYAHFLPLRNGQLPPGVPSLQSSATTPLLLLWKWDWSSEHWMSTEQ